jgi:hypothetical protein
MSIWNEQTEQVLAALARLEVAVKQIDTKLEAFMSTTNQSEANLLAGEAALATDIGKLGTTLSAAITDLQAEVAADLQAAGVPNSVVDGVTAKLAALDTTVQQLTTTTAAADPGAPPPPPGGSTSNPPPTPPAPPSA